MSSKPVYTPISGQIFVASPENIVPVSQMSVSTPIGVPLDALPAGASKNSIGYKIEDIEGQSVKGEV